MDLYLNLGIIALVLIIIFYTIYKLICHLKTKVKNSLKITYGITFALISAGLGCIMLFIVPFFMEGGENYAVWGIQVYGVLFLFIGSPIAYFIGYFIGKYIEKKRSSKS